MLNENLCARFLSLTVSEFCHLVCRCIIVLTTHALYEFSSAPYFMPTVRVLSYQIDTVDVSAITILSTLVCGRQNERIALRDVVAVVEVC